MQLDLTETERRALNIALDAHLLSLRNELAHTDDRAYRQMLRDRLDCLERLTQRVSGAPGPRVAAAPWT